MKQKDQSVFTRTLGLNFVIVGVIIICVFLSSIGMRRTLLREEEDNCRNMLTSGMKHLSSHLQAVRNDILLFRDSLSKENFKGLRRYDAVNLLNAKSSLTSIVNGNDIINDIALVYEDRDMAITSNGIYYSIDNFLSFYHIEEMDTSIFHSYLDSGKSIATMRFLPCSSIRYWDKTAVGTAFCFAIPLDTDRFTTNKGVAFVFVDLEYLIDIFVSERIRPYASFYLYDHRTRGSGTQLLEIRSIYHDQGGYFDSTIINSMGTLRAEIRISNKYLDVQMAATRRYFSWILIASVLSGIGTALWASYLQYLPMKQAIRMLRDRGLLTSRRKNEYSTLMNSVDKLLQEKEIISHQLSGYQASLHQNLLDRLFSSNLLSYDSEEALRMELNAFPSKALVYCGRIFIPSADTNQSMKLTLVMILEYLRKNLPPSAVLHSTDTLTFGLIYPCEEDMNSAEEPLRKILADIPQKFSARIVLTLGGQCENMHQIGPFFERAQSAYIEDEKYRLSERLIIHPGDLYDQEQGLNLKMLQEMYQFMMAGDENNAIAAMKRFYECPADALLINLKERYYVLRTHIMMAAREIMPDHPCPEIRMIRCGNTLEEQTHSLIEGIRQVCGYVLQRKTSVQEDQCAIYTDYLKEHFSDPELCASSLANEFKVSEKYLFGLFKKKTGYSPTSFLHHIRMEEAIRLLIECDDTVQEISIRVGFANFGTFYKAFKREYGIAPGKYRETHQPQGQST